MLTLAQKEWTGKTKINVSIISIWSEITQEKKLMQCIIFTASFIRPSDDTIKFDRYFCT